MGRTNPPLRLVEPAREAGGEPGDDALMLRAAAGDASAFRALVVRHETAVRRFCRSIVRDEALAADAAQDTFLRIWARRGRYADDGRFRGFLFTVARNVSRSMMRRRAIWSAVGLKELPATTVGPAEALEAREAIDVVTAAMDRLPEKLRTPLVLRMIEELPYEEIAAVIGRTLSTARSRVHFALKALRARLPEDVRP